jgi:hypothetical protein
MRDYITATCLGFVSKLYDDLTDNSIIGEGIIKETLFTLLCFLLSAISYNDFGSSLLMFFLSLISFIGGPEQYENNKEKSLLFAFPIILILSFSSWPSFKFMDILIFFIGSIVLYFEALIIKEDTSVRKLITRAIGVFIFSAISFIGLTTNLISNSVLKIVFWCLGYVIVSVLYQIYALYGKNIHDIFETIEQKWSVPVNSKVVTDQPEKIETSSKNTKQEKVSDSQQEQV